MLWVALWGVALWGAVGCAQGALEESADGQLKSASLIGSINGGPELLHDEQSDLQKIRIYDSPQRSPSSVYRVPVGALAPGELLVIKGEVAVTRCNSKDIEGERGDGARNPCAQERRLKDNPYNYSPVVQAAFFYSHQESTFDPANRLSEWSEMKCTEGRHHCNITLGETSHSALPPDAQWVHIGITAHSDGQPTKSWHIITVENKKGQLQVARLKPTHQLRAELSSADVVSDGRLQLLHRDDDLAVPKDYELVYQLALPGLSAGSLIVADASFVAKLLYGGDCHPMVNSDIFITPDPNERLPDNGIRLTRRSGYNCTRHNDRGCAHYKAGMSLVPDWGQQTVYVNYVTTGHRTCVRNGDKWQLSPRAEGLLVRVVSP